MYDTAQQLDGFQTLLTDVTDQIDDDSERLHKLSLIANITEEYGVEGLSQDTVAIMKVALEYIGVGSCGLEEFNDNAVASTQYVSDQLDGAIAGAEGDLTESVEGFFDVFKSFNSKTLSWIDEARRDLAKMQSNAPRGGTATVQLRGDVKELASGVADVQKTVSYLTNGYHKETVRVANDLIEQMRKVFSNRANFDIAIRNINKLTVQHPGDFSKAGDTSATSSLLGGSVMKLTLDGKDSDSKCETEKGTTEVSVTTEQVLDASRKAGQLLNDLERYVKVRQASEKAVDDASDRKTFYLMVPVLVGAMASSLGFAYAGAWAGAAAASSPQVRRRFRLLFTEDNQRKLAAELRAANKLMDATVDVGRRAIADLLKAGNALKA